MKKIYTILILLSLAGCGKKKTEAAKQQIQIGDIFYVKWGYPSGIRKYKCVDTNSNGYFVKWIEATRLDDDRIEFMPNRITNNIAFKMVSENIKLDSLGNGDIGKATKQN